MPTIFILLDTREERGGPSSTSTMAVDAPPFALPSDYGFVVAAAGVIGMVQLFLGGGVMGCRTRFFKSPEFAAKKEVKSMAAEHKHAFGVEPNDMGYPDMGCGRYADQLSYEQWVEINNAQRAHYNMVESSGPVLASMALGGLILPRVCAGLGLAYAVARFLYAQGYNSKKGADGRMVGAAMGALSTLGLFGICIAMGLHKAIV